MSINANSPVLGMAEATDAMAAVETGEGAAEGEIEREVDNSMDRVSARVLWWGVDEAMAEMKEQNMANRAYGQSVSEGGGGVGGREEDGYFTMMLGADLSFNPALAVQNAKALALTVDTLLIQDPAWRSNTSELGYPARFMLAFGRRDVDLSVITGAFEGRGFNWEVVEGYW